MTTANLKTFIVKVFLALALIAVGPVAPAMAGTIFLSGDGTTTSALDGSLGSPVDAGNKAFFSNVLDGGTSVVILKSGSPSLYDVAVNDYYNSLGGVSSAIVSGPITAAMLAGANLFVSSLPPDDFTAGEISALSGLLNGGGTVFFLGENMSFPVANGRINVALAALGSGMRIIIDDPQFDAGYPTATGAQIAVDPFTAGVTSFTYGAPSSISGGTALFFGTGGQRFVAYETVSAVPEPGTVAVFGLGLAAILVRRLLAERRRLQ